ncbi:MAG: hypothetical protein IJ691_11295 [Lachnospiraceae bacterium]|nr:hypothetical protein [Lachnospiraceae bacterium]
MSKIKTLSENPVIKTVITAITTVILCILLLTLSACIPRERIQKNSRLSAEYFAERDAFPVLFGNFVNSMQDNYSDTVLCDIIYCIDTKHPFESVIRAEYAQEEGESASAGFLAAVNGEEKAKLEYGRYWHGTMVILRPLLMLFSIMGIRILFGAVCMMIQISIIIIQAKRGKMAFSVCYLISLLLMEPWMFFTSLEYGTAFCTASVAELMVILKIGGLEKSNARKKQVEVSDGWLMPFFTAVGVVTCFVDFLTTETMTFTLPMLFVLLERAEMATVKDGFLRILKNGVCWFGGYVCMFLTKILFLRVVAGDDIVRSSLAEGLFRFGGKVNSANIDIAPVVDIWRRLSGAIWHNLACLYPTQAGLMKAVWAWLPTVVIIGVGLITVYLLQDGINWKLFTPLFFLAAIPYLRFLVLSNHSYIHFFITYRAQMVTVVIFLFFVYENGLGKLRKNK